MLVLPVPAGSTVQQQLTQQTTTRTLTPAQLSYLKAQAFIKQQQQQQVRRQFPQDLLQMQVFCQGNQVTNRFSVLLTG